MIDGRVEDALVQRTEWKQANGLTRRDEGPTCLEGVAPASTLRVGFLVGTPYCGSTLTAILMDTHPEVASVGEVAPNLRIRRRGIGEYPCSCGEPLSQCNFWRGVFKLAREKSPTRDFRDWMHDYRHPNKLLSCLLDGYSHRASVQFIRSGLINMIPGSRRKIQEANGATCAFMNAVLQLAKAAVFLDTSKSLDRLNYVSRIPGVDVRVINLVKDVRAYACSAKRRGLSAKNAATRWLNQQAASQHLFHRMKPDHILTVKHEEFCHNAVETVHRICQHLEICEWDPPQTLDPRDHHVIGNKIRLAGPFQIRAPEDWRANLLKEEMADVVRIAGAMNEQLGYTDT